MASNRIAADEFEAAKLRAIALRNQAMRKLTDALWRGMTTPIALPQVKPPQHT